MSRVNPYVLLDYAYVIIYDCLCFRLNKPKVRFTTLAYKYLVCAKEAALRRLRIIATIYSAFYRSIQHDENKEWQLANCVNRNFNPSIKPTGKKQLITLNKLVIDKSNQGTRRQYLFWKAQFNNYCNYTVTRDEERLGILVGKIEVNVYDYI